MTSLAKNKINPHTIFSLPILLFLADSNFQMNHNYYFVHMPKIKICHLLLQLFSSSLQIQTKCSMEGSCSASHITKMCVLSPYCDSLYNGLHSDAMAEDKKGLSKTQRAIQEEKLP